MEERRVCTQNKRAGRLHRNSTSPVVSLSGTGADGGRREAELAGAVQWQ